VVHKVAPAGRYKLQQVRGDATGAAVWMLSLHDDKVVSGGRAAKSLISKSSILLANHRQVVDAMKQCNIVTFGVALSGPGSRFLDVADFKDVRSG
jgi:hypothetical protein